MLVAEGGDPAAIVEARARDGRRRGELDAIVDRAIADNPDAVEKIKAGKAQAVGAIVGAVMRETKGRGGRRRGAALIREQIGA